jgi:hypothetical protein
MSDGQHSEKRSGSRFWSSAGQRSARVHRCALPASDAKLGARAPHLLRVEEAKAAEERSVPLSQSPVQPAQAPVRSLATVDARKEDAPLLDVSMAPTAATAALTVRATLWLESRLVWTVAPALMDQTAAAATLPVMTAFLAPLAHPALVVTAGLDERGGLLARRTAVEGLLVHLLARSPPVARVSRRLPSTRNPRGTYLRNQRRPEQQSRHSTVPPPLPAPPSVHPLRLPGPRRLATASPSSFSPSSLVSPASA